ncbi:phage tail protein [Desulfovibrio sp. SGI.169]|uniref:phage tail protein n=1 Tax=Desulfovibrio sp. SGI.169 TaxID=3420561 RepID=UPI003D043368
MSLADNVQSLATRVGTEMKSQNERIDALENSGASPGIVERVATLEGKVVSATTTKEGLVRLNNTVTSASTTQAATANAVKTAYNKAVEAQNAVADKVASAEVPSYAAPDISRAVAVAIPLNTEGKDPYTVPADGFIAIRGIPSASNVDNYLYLFDLDSNKYLYQIGFTLGYGSGATVPVQAGMKLYTQKLNIKETYCFFMPAAGSEWSAS